MRRLLFLLLIPCLMAGKANGQAAYEIQGHASFALEELSRLADGTGIGGHVAITYPVYYEDLLHLVGKVGFNHYGAKSGEVEYGPGLFNIDSVYQGIPITAGARLYYGQERKFYTEGLLGLEIKRGDLVYDDDLSETSVIDPVFLIGGGFTITGSMAIIATLGVSNDLWRYANLGVSIRFGE